MKKVILIDGNNLLFRGYYATAYRGSILRNSKGFPTNALYSLINMLNKIINEENPEYMMIAFDKGKTFRHEKYEGYKDGRKETPLELKEQFPVAKEIVKALGIPCFEIDNYEADDIIGTFAKEVDRNPLYEATIISSDKDLLQLISDKVDMKLLKMNDYIRYNKDSFIEDYGFVPQKIIDLKALMGDQSDNIPGVKGIGEKTAIKLINTYGSLDEIYDNIDKITGSVKNKLIDDKENAYFSKELATIYTEVPIDKSLERIKYNGSTPKLVPLLKDYEFFSLLKKMNLKEQKEEISYEEVDSIFVDVESSIYLETDGNYHDEKLLGIGIANENGNYFIRKENICNIKIDKDVTLYTYDLKKLYIVFKYFGVLLENKIQDLMIEAYITNHAIKDDIFYLMNTEGSVAFNTEELLKGKKYDEIPINIVRKTRYIYDNRLKYYEELIRDDYLSLYEEIDLPLTYVLIDMEYTGVMVDQEFLLNMKDEVSKKISAIEEEIYAIAGTRDFNISSPKQLGKILFETLEIPYPKRIKDNKYSTSADVLEKIRDYKIVNLILEYRTLTKLYSNYIVGLLDYVKEDGKIHTIFNQNLTRTGRLSSSSPNLQNIPVREEYGKLIRKAFVASTDYIITSDYSQIELRVFAHMSGADNLINAFKTGMDIHTKTAMDIYGLNDEGDVNSSMRRNAKAVNFGILYGISSFGLSEDLGINFKEAKSFIDNYLKTYPGIKSYMDDIKRSAYENGFVSTLFGRRRKLDEIKSSNFMVRTSGERMALNTPIQGTAADILKIAMINIYNEFNKRGLRAKIIIQVHDELLIDCPSDEVSEVVEIVRDKMENSYKLSVPLKVDIEMGKNWYEAK